MSFFEQEGYYLYSSESLMNEHPMTKEIVTAK